MSDDDDAKGHFRCYVPKTFNRDHRQIIAATNRIVDEYQAKGFMLTLRQIFYQFVSRGWLRNIDTEYDRLGGIISDARMAGLVSWTAIEDRNRSLQGYRTWKKPVDAVKKARKDYKIDMWADQDWRPEVWVEKAALEGVIGGIANKLRVDFFATRGYNSQSEQWSAGQRFAGYVQKGQRPIVFHLGDHDPSGLDMTRDNQERLSLFAGIPILVQRLALNMPQIEQYAPPPNPVKKTDGRAKAYQAKYDTDESWELDALEPTVIQDLIENAILAIRDEKKWDAMLKKEIEEKRLLDEVIETMT